MLPATASVLLFALALGSGCRSNGERPGGPTAPVSSEVVLAPGQSARADGLTVTFDGVSADSRCPIGVQCVWEGDAVVVVTAVAPPHEAANLELHTSGRYPREGTYGRYRVRLVSLAPHPREGEGVPAGEYRATVLVSAP